MPKAAKKPKPPTPLTGWQAEILSHWQAISNELQANRIRDNLTCVSKFTTLRDKLLFLTSAFKGLAIPAESQPEVLLCAGATIEPASLDLVASRIRALL